jgi:hypothetical protein
MRTRRWIVLVVVVLVLAGGAAAAAIALSGNSQPNASSKPSCTSSGCGLVSQSLSQVQPVGFYGASCSGAYGDWFLKVMQEGASDQLKADYNLHWTSTSGSVARPSGSVTVQPVTGASSASDVTITIDNGKVTLQGTQEPSKTPIKATGTLTINILNQSAPTLEITESGLTEAERALGLNSPFNFNGQPLHLSIRKVQVLVGC